MIRHHWIARAAGVATALAFALSIVVPACAEDLILKKGTDVHLVFDVPMSSKTARVGDKIWFHVEQPVQVSGKTVIAEGTKVSGDIVKVDKRGHYGVNAKIQLSMSPIKTVSGRYAPLGFKSKGQDVSGKTGEAAAATVGGAVLLGPLGLAGGYFIPGKEVNARPGDKMTVTIDRDTFVGVK
jgi:hypothetical protein